MTESKEEDTQNNTWDLTTTLSPYLDLHMMFPLLEYIDGLISQKQISYKSEDVATARLSLLRPTNMVDYAMDIYKELHNVDDPPAEMEELKSKIFDELEELREGCKSFESLCHDESARTTLIHSGHWNIEHLVNSSAYPEINKKTIETYHKLAKFNYDCGDYSSANKMLEYYMSLFASPPIESDEDNDNNNKNNSNQEKQQEGNPNIYYLKEVTFDLLQVLWGRLSCEILLENWEASNVSLIAVKAAIEILTKKSILSPLEALEQRTWLLHWSLFVFWNNSTTTTPSSKKNSASGGLEQLIELFFSERYLQAITTNTPHLLRYLTSAVLLSKRTSSAEHNRRLIKDLIRVFTQSSTAMALQDPIVEFVDNLCIQFNFHTAQEKLSQCEDVLQQDFFLCKQTKLFMEEARIFIFEHYCRIHTKIDLDVLSEKLAMETTMQAERWIVDLIIRNVFLNEAKIDSEQRCVVMGSGVKDVHDLIREKLKDLNVRNGMLVGNLGNFVTDVKKKRIEEHRQRMLEDEDEY